MPDLASNSLAAGIAGIARKRRANCAVVGPGSVCIPESRRRVWGCLVEGMVFRVPGVATTTNWTQCVLVKVTRVVQVSRIGHEPNVWVSCSDSSHDHHDQTTVWCSTDLFTHVCFRQFTYGLSIQLFSCSFLYVPRSKSCSKLCVARWIVVNSCSYGFRFHQCVWISTTLW